MKTIFTVGAVVLATCLLSGCVNEQKVNQLASNVQTLNAKIARLEQDMKALRPRYYFSQFYMEQICHSVGVSSFRHRGLHFVQALFP
jgi:outer membrane murein-binding lipoprotein Lpp